NLTAEQLKGRSGALRPPRRSTSASCNRFKSARSLTMKWPGFQSLPSFNVVSIITMEHGFGVPAGSPKIGPRGDSKKSTRWPPQAALEARRAVGWRPVDVQGGRSIPSARARSDRDESQIQETTHMTKFLVWSGVTALGLALGGCG